MWTFFPKLDDDLVAQQTHSPYNRGIALGHGKVYVGTVDGRLIALDMADRQAGLGYQADRLARSSPSGSPARRCS